MGLKQVNKTQTMVKTYTDDKEFLDKIKERYGLKSKAMSLRLIIRKIKFMKVEGELR